MIKENIQSLLHTYIIKRDVLQSCIDFYVSKNCNSTSFTKVWETLIDNANKELKETNTTIKYLEDLLK